MSVTLASVRIRYPELTQAPDTLLTQCILDAEDQTDSDVFGDQYDAHVTDLVFKFASMSQYGRELRLVDDKSESIVDKQIKERARRRGAMYRTVWDIE